jgi:hypothetical protein
MSPTEVRKSGWSADKARREPPLIILPRIVEKLGVNSAIAIFPIGAGDVCITRPSAYA